MNEGEKECSYIVTDVIITNAVPMRFFTNFAVFHYLRSYNERSVYEQSSHTERGYSCRNNMSPGLLRPGRVLFQTECWNCLEAGRDQILQ